MLDPNINIIGIIYFVLLVSFIIAVVYGCINSYNSNSRKNTLKYESEKIKNDFDMIKNDHEKLKNCMLEVEIQMKKKELCAENVNVNATLIKDIEETKLRLTKLEKYYIEMQQKMTKIIEEQKKSVY